jgi:adenylate cyclase
MAVSSKVEVQPPLTAPIRRWRQQPRSITLTLTLSIGLLVLVAVTLVWGIGVETSRRNTLALLEDKAQLIVGTIELGVQNHLRPALDQLAFVGREIESGRIDPGDRRRLVDLMTGSLAAAPQIAGVIFWDTHLQQTAVLVDPVSAAVQVLHQDQRDQPEIIAAAAEVREAAGAFWGELVFDQGETYINLRRPLRRDGTYIGFLVAAVSIRELSEFVTRIGDMFDATAFILHGPDHVLAHPNLVHPHPDLSAEQPVARRDRVGDLVLAGFGSATPPPGLEALESADLSVERVSVGGVADVALYRWIADYGAVPWALGAYFPAADVTQELRRLRNGAIAGLVVLLIAVGAAVLLGRRIARPIRRAAAATRLVGELELSAVAPLPPSPIRELDDQARAFNTMLAALRWFEVYVPTRLVQRLIAKGAEQEVHSVERELSVLFTDVVGFTALSERLPAGETAAFLNHHFALLGAAVEAEGGTIDKFIGDALMAIWGAPDKQPDHALRACRAAQAMMTVIEADNARRQAAGEAPVRIRIGIHSGAMVVGNIGAPGRMNYTVVGDAVNTAQRLEALGKELDQGAAVTVLISGATAAGLGDAIALAPAGEFRVKGKEAPIEIFRLLAPGSAPDTGAD